MIKLIASDMDGTLLNGERNLPEEFEQTLLQLIDRNISFTIASGRSYVTLNKNFGKMSNKINFICDNGAYIVINGKLSYMDIIDIKLVRKVIELCSSLPDTKVILCGVNGIYHKHFDDKFMEEATSYYVKHVTVENLDEVNDDIFKIAICDFNSPATGSFDVLEKVFGDKLSIQISGALWMDVMNFGVNKGMALQKIQEYLGISKLETMAFGDYYNDIDLLSNAEYSFVMENAPKDMYKYGRYIAKSNTENGVINAINEYVLK